MRPYLRLVPSLLAIAVAGVGCSAGATALDPFDGERFGFLVEVSTDPAMVVIDPATWVVDDDEPNGFRIEDPNVPPVELPVADGAVIEVFRSTGDPGTAATVTVAELADWYADLAHPHETAPFDVTVAGGEVVEMRFVYRP